MSIPFANKKTLENFEKLSAWIKKKPKPLLLIASTLLVTGYVDETEVPELARFISSLNPEIPYSLLVFYPHFYLTDLPATSRTHAFAANRLPKKRACTVCT